MSNRVHVATRKGLFTIDRNAGGDWRVENSAFLGDPVSMSLSDRRTGNLFAALNLGHFGVKLHRSSDAGKTWTEIEVPTFPRDPAETATGETDAEARAPSLKQIWALEPGGEDRPGLLWAGSIPGGLFRSEDNGDSWELVSSLWDRPEREKWFGGGADHPGIHSICVDPRNSDTVMIAVSIGGVWVTEDGGQEWELRGKGMFAEYMPPEIRNDPNAQDPHLVVQSPSNPEVIWCQHHNGSFRSTDGGRNFVEIKPRPSVFGFAVAVHPTDPESAWFVPAVKDECRIPVDGQVVISRTRDGGKTFDILREGLPQEHAYDLVFRHALDIDDTGDRLAFGSTTGTLWVTEDQGDSWRAVSNHLPPIYSVRFEK